MTEARATLTEAAEHLQVTEGRLGFDDLFVTDSGHRPLERALLEQVVAGEDLLGLDRQGVAHSGFR